MISVFGFFFSLPLSLSACPAVECAGCWAGIDGDEQHIYLTAMYLIGSGTKRCVFTLSITMEHGWAEVVAVPGAVGVWPQMLR